MINEDFRYESFGIDGYHTTGYHGTSMYNARKIKKEGFKASNGIVCFAPIDNIYFAMQHGERRADARGDRTFGVVQATFPAHKLEFGLGGDQINVRNEDIGKIAVIAVLEFNTSSSGLAVARNRLPDWLG